jgi:hypothetical protein
MGLVYRLIPALAAAATMAMLLGMVAQDYASISADVLLTNALSVAGLLMAAVAASTLLKLR